MFDGADLHVLLSHHGATLGVDHVLSQRFDDGCTLQVGASDLVAVIFRGGFEGDVYVEARMQAFALQ